MKQVRVKGPMGWYGGVMISCEDCGVVDGIFLWCVNDEGLAWMVCPHGHRQSHPLVYPEVVSALSEITADAEDQAAINAAAIDALQRIQWRPHRLGTLDVDISTDASCVRDYQPWERFVRGVRADRWPEYLAAVEEATVGR
ncbi:hypothetical protein ABT324_28160 [Saccharopolyspora sp. NPDC000359]|uniref:hypothetical protein n=1 Tax=Saccharopolyspora sp. NPDC000359 TaxID=3154251 RepID=UPI00331661A0